MPFSNLMAFSNQPSILLLLGILACQAMSLVAVDRQGSLQQCRCFPGDTCWPTADEWDRFNTSINGHLISTIPIAAVCHYGQFGSYDAAACKTLQDQWYSADTHVNNPSSIMAALFTNDSCNPFSETNASCTTGNYVSYTVNATGVDDYRKTLQFVQQHNIRLVIKNTGHEYNGKSAGAGSVGLWTHHLKEIQIENYKSTDYSGKAL